MLFILIFHTEYGIWQFDGSITFDCNYCYAKQCTVVRYYDIYYFVVDFFEKVIKSILTIISFIKKPSYKKSYVLFHDW